MSLEKLIQRKHLNILGINSGTSVDGVDMAIISFQSDGRQPQIKYRAATTIPFPKKIKYELERVIIDQDLNFVEAARLDMAFGRYLGNLAADYISGSKLKIDLIASHGQTIGHYPKKIKHFGIPIGATVQIGHGNALAVASGYPVVSDFRQADISLGGEGAPLTPFVNQFLFGDNKSSRLIINIGGMANFSYHPAGAKLSRVQGGDCGPGNTLIDNASHLFFKKNFDENGNRALKGQILDEVVKVIKNANRRRKVSTGRELFSRELLARVVHRAGGLRADKNDIMASLSEATVRLIYDAIRKYLKDRKLEAVYLTGGGRKNLYLTSRLSKLCDPIPVLNIEKLGYDGDFLEAVSFAALGGCFIFGIPSTVPQVTGASSPNGIGGRLAWPAKK